MSLVVKSNVTKGEWLPETNSEADPGGWGVPFGDKSFYDASDTKVLLGTGW